MSAGIPCIVLAGGLGTRLRSVVADRPKCLAPIGPRSFLSLQLEALAAQGIDSFVLSLGHLAGQVEEEAERLRARFHIDCVTEPRALGTGGAVAFAMDRLGLAEAFVTNGDTFLGGDLTALLAPLAVDEDVRMATVDVQDRSRYGGVEIRRGRVCRFFEKGTTGPGAINAGLYRLRKSALAFAGTQGVFSLESVVLPELARRGVLTAVQIRGEFTDIGVPDDYLRFCEQHG